MFWGFRYVKTWKETRMTTIPSERQLGIVGIPLSCQIGRINIRARSGLYGIILKQNGKRLLISVNYNKRSNKRSK